MGSLSYVGNFEMPISFLYMVSFEPGKSMGWIQYLKKYFYAVLYSVDVSLFGLKDKIHDLPHLQIISKRYLICGRMNSPSHGILSPRFPEVLKAAIENI